FSALLVFTALNVRSALYPNLSALTQPDAYLAADKVSMKQYMVVPRSVIKATGSSMNVAIEPRTTGSAVPFWTGETVSLAWNTPVTEMQTVQLYLLSTPWMRLWRVLAVISTLGLFALCVGVRLPKISPSAVLTIGLCV